MSAASQQATEPVARRLNDAEVRQVFLRHGFTIKEGQADLKPYVFDAAHALMDAMLDAAPATQQPEGQDRGIELAFMGVPPGRCLHEFDCDAAGANWSIWRCRHCGTERRR